MRASSVIHPLETRSNFSVDEVFAMLELICLDSLCADGSAQIFQEGGFPCVMCCHIADGNFHCIVPFQPEEKDACVALEGKVIAGAIALGGTVSGEHGIGVGKIHVRGHPHSPVAAAPPAAVSRPIAAAAPAPAAAVLPPQLLSCAVLPHAVSACADGAARPAGAPHDPFVWLGPPPLLPPVP